jgi:hypothetical protein
MADNVAITAGSGTSVSTESVTTRDGSSVSAEHVQYTARAYVVRDGDAVTPIGVKFAKATVNASSTNNSVVAAVTGRKIRVLSVYVVTGLSSGVAGSTKSTYKFVSKPAGSGTDITDATDVSSFRQCEAGLFQTAAGDALCLTTGAGSQTYVEITYIEA